MTLSEAVAAIWPPSAKGAMIKEGPSSVMAEIQGMLANRPEEIEEEEDFEEEPAETKEAEQKNHTETEVQPARENSKKIDAKMRPEKEIDEMKHSALHGDRTERTSGLEGGLRAVRAEPAARVPEVLSVAGSTPGSLKSESVISKSSYGITRQPPPAIEQPTGAAPATERDTGADRRILAFKVPEAVAPEFSVIKAEPKPDSSQIAISQEPEPLSPPAATEALIGERMEPASKTEAAEEKPALAATGYQPDTDSPADFEEEFPLDHSDETGLEADEAYEIFDMSSLEMGSDSLAAEEELVWRLNGEPGFSERIETGESEPLIPVNLNVEAIEDSLVRLAERIEAGPSETAGKVNELLDKIVEVPEKLAAHSGEDVVSEAQAQEELEELFTQLLDNVGLDHTPELIESLARLTLGWQLAGEIEKMKIEKEMDKTPRDSGTHEIIKKLLAALGIIKKAMAHASAIGKSALQLYIFSFAA